MYKQQQHQIIKSFLSILCAWCCVIPCLKLDPRTGVSCLVSVDDGVPGVSISTVTLTNRHYLYNAKLNVNYITI